MNSLHGAIYTDSIPRLTEKGGWDVQLPLGPIAPTPAPEPQATTHLPTHREEREGQAHGERQRSRNGRNPSPKPKAHRPDAVPDGTFLASLDSLDPLFDRYSQRIRHIRNQLSTDQRQLLGALYATAEHRGYDLRRIDAIANRFVDERTQYSELSVPSPVAASGLVLDTQA